ncbi:MAG: hypothetical protein H7326_01720 [Bdellovibrionaceae bacterium]|nr:hypothetical protein [Pseudobdellovibrionaceae bacterium]
MKKYISPFLLVAALIMNVSAEAALSPISVNIAPPVQFPPSDFNVNGIRASVFWGRHRDVRGIDLAIGGNITEQSFTGIAVSGLFNYTKGTTDAIGMQFAGLTNINTSKTSVYGLQFALGANYNQAASEVWGVQLAALANVAPFTDIYGFQIGLYNRAKDVYGLQIGLVNVADNLHGVQIGLANFNKKGPFEISPILNVGF